MENTLKKEDMEEVAMAEVDTEEEEEATEVGATRNRSTLPGHPALQVHPVQRAIKETQVLQAILVLLVHRVIQVKTDLPARGDQRAKEDYQVTMEFLENKASLEKEVIRAKLDHLD